MNRQSFDSTVQGSLEPLSAFELFLRYNRNRLLRSNRNTLLRNPDSGSGSNQPSLTKAEVQSVLDENPGHGAMPLENFRRHMSCLWKVVDEETKLIFKQLSRERQSQFRFPASDGLLPPPRKLSSINGKLNRMEGEKLDEANQTVLAPRAGKCPAMQSNEDNCVERSPRVLKRQKGIEDHALESSRDESIVVPKASTKNPESISPRPGMGDDKNTTEKGSHRNAAAKDTPPRVKLLGIHSLVDAEDGDVSADEFRSFLANFDWDRRPM